VVRVFHDTLIQAPGCERVTAAVTGGLASECSRRPKGWRCCWMWRSWSVEKNESAGMIDLRGADNAVATTGSENTGREGPEVVLCRSAMQAGGSCQGFGIPLPP